MALADEAEEYAEAATSGTDQVYAEDYDPDDADTFNMPQYGSAAIRLPQCGGNHSSAQLGGPEAEWSPAEVTLED